MFSGLPYIDTMKKIILVLVAVIVAIFLFTQRNSNSINLSNLNSDTKILAFGDSLTYGVGASSGFSYPDSLAKILQVEVTNSGVPGEVSQTGLQRLTKELEQTRPDILVLCHGGNDILQKRSSAQAKKNILAMIDLAQSKGIRVVFVGVPSFAGLGLKTADIYDEIASQTGVDYEGEILQDLLSESSLKSDSVHLNDEGYEKMAVAIAKVITNQ